MAYLLDSNVLIHVLRARPTHAALAHRVRGLGRDEALICPLVRAELMFGARKSTNPTFQLNLVAEYLRPFPSAPLNDAAADHAARIRFDLAAIGKPIGPNDLLIAAIALAHNLTLVTHNAAEFARVEGLQVEDWEQPQ